MVAGEPVGVLHDSLFIHADQDRLTTHGADAVREVFSGHPRRTVILRTRNEKVKREHEYMLPLRHVKPDTCNILPSFACTTSQTSMIG